MEHLNPTSAEHSTYSLRDFKPQIVTSTNFVSLESAENTLTDDIGEGHADTPPDCRVEALNYLPNVIECSSFA